MADAVEITKDALQAFQLDRVLIESPSTKSVYLLGTLSGATAIVHLEKVAFKAANAAIGELLETLAKVNSYLVNPPYSSSHAWLEASKEPDVVIKVICPATETHVRKYAPQERFMVRETPEMYQSVVKPYIESFDASRLKWVYQILAHEKEADRIVYEDEDPDRGFIILPDLKWDQTSMSALYLTTIVHTRTIRSIRDLTTDHLPLLNNIRRSARETVHSRYGVHSDKIRIFVHYQPSYYHFHVHIVHVDHEGFAGLTVGQAHMLDSLITLLELSQPSPAPSLLAQMSFTYALGAEHGLYEGLAAAQRQEA